MKPIALTLTTPILGKTAERMVLAPFFLIATFLGAYLIIPLPFTPVPLTMQTLFVLLGAAWLGGGWSTGVQGSYLGLGAAGFSVFAGAVGGVAILMGPTAGYLWAFLPASLLVGSAYGAAAKRGLLYRIGLFAAADALILFLGSAWLGLLLGLTPTHALLLGAAPFIPGEAVKVAIAVFMAPRPNIK